jgi:hypothetical protein
VSILLAEDPADAGFVRRALEELASGVAVHQYGCGSRRRLVLSTPGSSVQGFGLHARILSPVRRGEGERPRMPLAYRVRQSVFGPFDFWWAALDASWACWE